MRFDTLLLILHEKKGLKRKKLNLFKIITGFNTLFQVIKIICYEDMLLALVNNYNQNR